MTQERTADGIRMLADNVDKALRYDLVYKALLDHDKDFAFEHAVMGDEWMRANYSYVRLNEMVARATRSHSTESTNMTLTNNASPSGRCHVHP